MSYTDFILNINYIDAAFIAVLVVYLLHGLRRGFVLGIIDLLSFIVSFFAALKLYGFTGGIIAQIFNIPKGISGALGFVITGVAAEIIFGYMTSYFVWFFIQKLKRKYPGRNERADLIFANRLFGLFPAFGEALVFSAFLLTLAVSLPIRGDLKSIVLSSYSGKILVSKTQDFEASLKAVFGSAVNDTLTFFTVNPNPYSGETHDLGFKTSDVYLDAVSEREMLELVNRERRENGLTPLVFSRELTLLAESYARDMFIHGYFSHNDLEGRTPFDRMNEWGILFSVAGENLAFAPNVALAHQGLMNSSGHRANILNSEFKKAGIGVVDSGIYGKMFVQEFTD